ncbi:hypothetical protein [Bartonella melophagi]|uniref:Uncharacterized protein n=1 Tax=Bartonella melophagi K-2C TaxID=1094557 RepID=J0R5K2_9HYPH|nr:hypothetical protein [Bartonella melophagi]EJF90944.1 hypothetical protein ME3_00574 [Bartonella melophagi K-2C]
MAITIQTAGPLEIKREIFPHDQNFIQMVGDIQDEVDDQTNEYVDQVQNAIFSAIRFCERFSFYFNESRELVLTTLQGKNRYGDEAHPSISGAIEIIDASIEDSNHSKSKLLRVDPIEIEGLDEARRGLPTRYAYFAQKLVFYPTPDNSYFIRLIVGPMRVKTIKNVREACVWFLEAYELIKTRAKYELYANILKEPQMASTALAMFQEQLNALQIETSRRKNFAQIHHTDF